MSILKVLSVKDLAAQSFGRPIFVPAIPLAVRSFTQEVNRSDPQNDMHLHPSDFELYELGDFDDTTGIFAPIAPRLVSRAVDVRTPEA